MRFRLASLALLAVVSVAAHADSLTFSLSNATQTISASGGTLIFSGTLTAASTNTGNEYLTGDLYNVASPLTLDDSVFYNTPVFLTPGQSYTGALFSVLVPSGTAAKGYTGSFAILGGANSSAQNTLASQSFTVNVASAVAVTPEPSSLLLLGTGMVGAVAAFRRRVVSFSR